ncbi:hypothetical protein BACCIP111895_02399 [Neobacillus rhizosphaerae]|uniref:Uncharacterized protein n=1 Tax=Neobacillus rhizosphaerae TaxID=2880965 RepID=A0ABM9ESR1_9BACI|nr:hypothetical protein [Neobacillus rhizosphaerae]CAH2715215.1 hypothetical protein BACCIP111895_02399 [Neobacillus rhizosphaerae]
MVNQRALLEQTGKTQYIPPKGDYETFRDEDHYKEKLKEWGLSSAKEAKKEFWYKDRNNQRHVTIKGFETYGGAGDINTLVIEFQDGNLSCIHPAYLKEMQQSSFGKESLLTVEDKEPLTTASEKPAALEPKSTAVEETETTKDMKSPRKEAAPKPAKAKEPKAKKEKAPKLELPAEKVHFTASVKQFALTYNPFNEENDEVVVLENVQIVQENPIDIGLGWCSHSKTLKKFELSQGDSLEFDGKVTAKKLAKGKDVSEEFVVDVAVLYKINNPSKIVKK